MIGSSTSSKGKMTSNDESKAKGRSSFVSQGEGGRGEMASSLGIGKGKGVGFDGVCCRKQQGMGAGSFCKRLGYARKRVGRRRCDGLFYF